MPSFTTLKALSALSFSALTGPASFPANFQDLPESHRSYRSEANSPVQIRAEIYLLDGSNKPVALGGKNFSTKKLNELLESGFTTVVNGSFFRTGRTAGDIIGAELNDPTVPLNRPFNSPDKRLNAKVFSRYYIGERLDGQWEIGKRSNVIDANGKQIPQGKDLTGQFNAIIGGLAYIGLDKPAIQKALVKGDRESVVFFRNAFNIWNQNYNNMSAYDGLQGSRARPRTAVILATDNSSGVPVMIIMSVGRGTKELSGVSLFSLARNGYYLCSKYSCAPISMAVLDGGSSVCFGSMPIETNGKTSKLVVSSGATPLSGFAIKSLKPAR